MSGTLFPAWRPGADGRDVLAALSHRLQKACPPGAPFLQLRRPDQWHVTLCFIGHDADSLVTPALHAAFADAATRVPTHAWTVAGLAYWPGSGAIVALPRPCPALQALCDTSRDAIRRCGITPAEVTRQPHLTLAYLHSGPPSLPWLDDVECGGDALRVDRFELLCNPGGRYDALAGWPLSGAALASPPRQDALF